MLFRCRHRVRDCIESFLGEIKNLWCLTGEGEADKLQTLHSAGYSESFFYEILTTYSLPTPRLVDRFKRSDNCIAKRAEIKPTVPNQTYRQTYRNTQTDRQRYRRDGGPCRERAQVALVHHVLVAAFIAELIADWFTDTQQLGVRKSSSS